MENVQIKTSVDASNQNRMCFNLRFNCFMCIDKQGAFFNNSKKKVRKRRKVRQSKNLFCNMIATGNAERIWREYP